MHYFMGLFTYTSPQAGVGRVQSHRAVFACACVHNVCAVVRWIIIQTSPVFIFSVLSTVGNPLLTGLAKLYLCVRVQVCVRICRCVSRCLSGK